MACRSVNNLRLSRDEMRKIYKDEMRKLYRDEELAYRAVQCGVRIDSLVKDLEILGPFIAPFFKQSANGSGHMACAEDFGHRIVSEDEFERLLDYVDQCNVKM